MTAGRLAGKRGLITGAASGIGRTTAVQLARDGADVALLDINSVESTAMDIRSSGRAVSALQADVSDEVQIERAFGEAVSALGGLDFVVGVAGIELFGQGDDRVDRLRLDVWERILGTNLTGMFLTCKHGARALLRSGGGSIVVTGSPTGLFGLAPLEHAYSASKAGIHGLARVMAADFANDGIRVNIVVPGFIDTPLNAPVFADRSALDQLLQTIPMKRPGRPDEVARMISWLVSDEASYATGGFFTVDGGMTAI